MTAYELNDVLIKWYLERCKYTSNPRKNPKTNRFKYWLKSDRELGQAVYEYLYGEE